MHVILSLVQEHFELLRPNQEINPRVYPEATS